MNLEIPMPRSWRYSRDRKVGVEAMDRPDLAPVLREQALFGLERLRRCILRPRPLLEAIVKNLPPSSGRTIRLVELGAGSIALSDWIGRELKRLGWHVEMVVTDKVAGPGVKFFDCSNYYDWMDTDLFFSNLLLHHLDEVEIRRSLAFQSLHSCFGSVHLDLVRGAIPYYITRVFMPLLGYSRINQSDGLLSIQAAFSAQELVVASSSNSGITEVRSVLPFRQILVSRPLAA